MATKYKTFTDYYREDPEFRKKHLERLKERIVCECGFETSRNNLPRHRKSHLHIEKMEKIERVRELRLEMKSLSRELKQLEKQLEQ